MAFQPIVLKNVDLVLGDTSESTNFKCQLKSVKLIPDVNIIKEKTACPSGTYSEVENPEWNLELGHLTGRDAVEAEAALSEYLRVHSGEKSSFAFRPFSGDHLGGYKGRITLVATEIGGQVGGMNTATVQLPLDGQPTPLTAAENTEDAPAVWA